MYEEIAPASESEPRDVLGAPGARAGAALVVFLAYFAGARLGLSLSFKPDYIAALWPPNAVLLAALALTHPRHWWYLLAVAVPAELVADVPLGITWPTALAFVGADIVEALAGALLLRAALRAQLRLHTLRETMFYMLCCIVAAPFISAFPGAATTLISGSGTGYWAAWRTWFMGDSLTHMILTPFLVIAVGARPQLWRSRVTPARVFEGVILGVLLACVSLYVFSTDTRMAFMGPSILYLPMPILLWAAVRFGSGGIFSASLFFAFIAIRNASIGIGPFTAESPAHNVLTMQIYFLLALLPLILLAAIIRERNRAQHDLMAYRAHLENLVEERTQKLRDAQQQLIESERLAVLGQFAGSLAHEIRNPLSVIVNSAYYLKKNMAVTDPRCIKYLDKIQERSLHTAELIDSVQRMARMEPPRFEACDVVALVSQICHTFDTPQNIQTRYTFPPGPLVASLDAQQFEIALKNILKNAVQCMDSGGTLSVDVAETGDGFIQTRISDTGKGIAEDAQHRIFEPLYTTKIYGIGFGLSIVKMIVEQHGGTLSVASQLNHGSAFTISLPKR